MIYAIVRIETVPGRREAVLAEFRIYMSKAIQEPGCLEFLVTEDVETPFNPGEVCSKDGFTVFEKWETLEHFKNHIATPHMKAHSASKRDSLISIDIRLLDPIDPKAGA